MIDYITNSKKPYPDWLKNHKVFQELPKIDKVFPKFGLPNFQESCEIMNSSEASAEATRLGNRIITELQRTQNTLYNLLETALRENGKDRNEKCYKLQSLISLIASIQYSIRYNDYIKLEEGKVALRLRSDIFSESSTPIFKKNQGLISVIGKIYESLTPFIKMTPLDQFEEFKSFSKYNIPNKQYKVVFSSTGEEGAWDIGTMSMRGIISCQAWTSPQSRGLIGSIASKFVGVIYIASGQNIDPYGSKMLYRSIVRFIIDKASKKPALLLDTIYPSATPEIIKAFKKTLTDKSGLDVCYSRDGGNYTNYYTPNEPARKFLANGEFPYMDYNITVQEHSPIIKRPNDNITSLTKEFKDNVANDIAQMIIARKAMYDGSIKQYEELKTAYDQHKAAWAEENKDKPEDEKSKFEEKRPVLDREIAFFGKTGSMVNLLQHCDKKHGNNSAGKVFAMMILDSFSIPDTVSCETKEEYHRKYLMKFLKNGTEIKEKALAKVKAGTWMASFPKSAEKLYEFVFGQMKGYIIAGMKEIIKKSN